MMFKILVCLLGCATVLAVPDEGKALLSILPITVTDVLQLLNNITTSLYKIVESVTQVINGVTDKVDSIIDGSIIPDLVQSISDTVTKATGTTAAALSCLQTKQPDILNIATNEVESLKNCAVIAQTAVQTLNDALNKFQTDTKNIISLGQDSMVKCATDPLQSLKCLKDLFDNLKKQDLNVTTLGESLLTDITNKIAAIDTALATCSNSVRDASQQAIQTVINNVQSCINLG